MHKTGHNRQIINASSDSMTSSLDSLVIRCRIHHMSLEKSQFSTAEEWREAARQRNSVIDEAESCRRKALADAYNRNNGTHDPDIFADQQLYIQGKMDIEEYQNYLLFKHSHA